MAKILSPGQKRRRNVQIVTATLFILLTLIGGNIYGRITSVIYDWVGTHELATGTINELDKEVEEYRNSKGRMRSQTIYSVTYSFTVNGEEYDNWIEVSNSEYSRLKVGDPISIAYNPESPYENDTEESINDIQSSDNVIGHAFSVAPYTAIAALFIYRILAFLFVRESKKTLPEGFYTQRSWLDVDDKVLVAAEGDDIVFFDIHKNRVDEIQEAFQNGASLDEMISLNKKEEVTRVPMADITEMRSDHNTDTIRIEHSDESHSVEFLNAAVKHHALERFKLMISDELIYRKKSRTRLQAVIPPLIWLAAFVGLFLFFDMFFIKLVLGFIAIFMTLPKVIGQLISPTQTEYWERPSEEDPQEAAQSA